MLSGGPPGDYYIELVPVGERFDSSLRPLTLLSLFGAPPPPILVQAKFDDSGAGAKVTFSGNTNYGGISSDSWVCNRLFSFTGVNDTTCAWTSASQVHMVYPF